MNEKLNTVMKKFKDFIAEEKLTPVEGTQYGSNDGGIHTNSKGHKFYVKKYHNPEQAKTEALTGKIYHHMGIKTVKPEMHGGTHIKSKWNEHLESVNSKHTDKISKKHAKQLGKMYHAGILTKNWDILGPHDLGNVMHHKKTGDLHSIDHGGAFHFRAQGGHKDYGHDIDEKKSLRGEHGYKSSHLFNKAFKEHPEAEHHGLEAVKKIDDKHIHHLFKHSGLKNWEELHKNFHERKKKLIASYEDKKD